MSFTTSLGYTPVYQVNYNGQDITGQFNDRVTTIRVTSVDGGGQADQLEIVLDDRGFEIETPNINGGSIEVFLGYKENALYSQGSFTLDGVSFVGPPKSLKIKASSSSFLSNLKAPIISSFDGKTLGDIIGSIANAAGASANVDPNLAGQTIQYLNQHSSSMHLLQELERRYDGLAKFQDGVLSFSQRGSGNSVSGQFLGGFELTPEDFGTWDINQLFRTGYSKVRASYWDRIKNELVWLANTNDALGNSTVPFMIKRSYNTQEEAQTAANSKMAALNRGILRGYITLAKGDPSIHAGSPFIINGMRDPINGSFLVQTATHTFTKGEGIATVLDVFADGSEFAAKINR